VEAIHLSHWHRDHSGGMLKAIKMISEAKETMLHLSSSIFTRIVQNIEAL